VADLDSIRSLVRAEQRRVVLSWQLTGRPLVTSQWWARGVPPNWVGRLRPGELPPPDAYRVAATGVAGVISALEQRAQEPRPSPSGVVATLAVPLPGPARASALRVARERRPSIVERAVARIGRARAPRVPRARRQDRPPRKPRRPRPNRFPRAPRPPRVPRIPGGQGRLWCYGLKQGFTLYPPPSARGYPYGVNPNSIPPWIGTNLWTPARSLADCAGALCRGPLGSWFARQMRRLFPPPEPDPLAGLEAITKRRERRRARTFLPAAVPVVPNPPIAVPAPPPPPGVTCVIWTYKFQLYPPPNKRGYPPGVDPNTFPGQAGLWTCTG